MKRRSSAVDMTDGCLSTRFLNTVRDVPAADWDRLLPGEAENWTYFRVVEQTPSPSFSMGVIAAVLDRVIVGVVPVFRTRYELDTSMQADDLASRLRVRLFKYVPRLNKLCYDRAGISSI